MPTTPTALQTLLLNLINADRATAGLRPLVLDAELIAAAEGQAKWMLSAGVFSHTGQGGSNPGQRENAAGYSWMSYGENIAYLAGTSVTSSEAIVRQLHTNLMNSPPHRANLLNTGFTQIGLGIIQGTWQNLPAVMLCEDFGLPTAAEEAEGTGMADAAPSPATPAPATPTPAPQTPAATSPMASTPTPSTPAAPATVTPGPVRVTVASGGTTLTVQAKWNGAGYDVAVVPAG